MADDMVPALYELYETKMKSIRPDQPKPPAEVEEGEQAKLYPAAGMLYIAQVSNGDVDGVKKILEKGGDVNSMDQAGMPMLVLACTNGAHSHRGSKPFFWWCIAPALYF